MNSEVPKRPDPSEDLSADEAAVQSFNKDFLFRSVFKHAPIGIAVVGLNGRFLKVNRSLCETLGYTEQEFYSRTFQSISHPLDPKEDLNHDQRLLDGEASTYKLEKRCVNKAGQTTWILLSVALVRDPSRVPLFFISQMQKMVPPAQLDQRPSDPLGDPKQLNGLIPICMYCKNIRTELNLWQKVEAYVAKHTRFKFSHCVCPDCMGKFKTDLSSNNQR
jgi:PAS domain S-box-containing protein